MSATGKWNVVMTTPMGDQKVLLDLVADADELKGSMTGPNGTNTVDEGRVDGNALTWRSKLIKPMPMDLVITEIGRAHV